MAEIAANFIGGRGNLLFLAIALVGASVGCSQEDRCKGEVPGTVCGVAGSGELGFNQDGLPPDETDFFLPTRATRGPDGLIYIVDFNNWRVRRIDDDGLVRTIAGNGFHAPAFPGAPAIESPLDNPTDFDFLPDGRLAMVSFEDPRIIVLENDVVSVMAGTGEVGEVGNEGDGFHPIFASFIEVQGIVAAPDGTVYLADSLANRVRVLREQTIETFAGSGETGFSGDEGPAEDALLNYPTALALDAAGNLYIADSLNHVVRRIDSDGVIRTIAGTGAEGLSGDGGPAIEAQLNEPFGVAVDEDGTVYISDRSNFRIRRVTPDGIIDTVAGTDQGYSGDGGAATKAQFGFLARISLDGNSLLIADQSNGSIRKLILDK